MWLLSMINEFGFTTLDRPCIITFEWSPPGHFKTYIWTYILTFYLPSYLSFILAYSGMLPDILSGMFVSGISSAFFWHSIWYIFKPSLWYIYICHIFWHSIWHVYLAHLLTFFLAFYLQSFFVVEVQLGSLSSSACSWGPAEEKASWHKI